MADSKVHPDKKFIDGLSSGTCNSKSFQEATEYLSVFLKDDPNNQALLLYQSLEVAKAEEA